MTATTAALLPIQKKRVRAAMMSALGRHGVSQVTAESIWHDLTTGNDPRPANLPEGFHYRGIKIDWPIGRHLRPVRKDEMQAINTALRAAGVRTDLLDAEDNAEAARLAYGFLFAHKNGHDSKMHGAYNPEPVRAAKLRELVEEATAQREIDNAPILMGPDESVPLLTGTEHIDFDCAEINPGQDRLCVLAHGHDGQHRNGGTRWGKRDRVFAAEVAAEIAAAEVVAEQDAIECPFGHAECLTMQEQGEGACETHQPPTREQLIEAAQASEKTSKKNRTNVQIVTAPDTLVTAQVVALETTTDIDDLLADLVALSKRLGA